MRTIWKIAPLNSGRWFLHSERGGRRAFHAGIHLPVPFLIGHLPCHLLSPLTRLAAGCKVCLSRNEFEYGTRWAKGKAL